MEQRQWLATIAIGNLVVSVFCAVTGGVFLMSRSPMVVLYSFGIPRVSTLLLIPLLMANSPAFSGGLLILLAGALLASAIGSWRRDAAARKLESVLLWIAVAWFTGSGGMGLLFYRSLSGLLLLATAAAAGSALWWLHLPETRACFGEVAPGPSRSRLVVWILGGLAVGLLAFIWVMSIVARALQGLR